MKTPVVGEACGDVVEMGGEVDTGTCHSQVPHDLASGNHERGDQGAGTVANVLVLAFLGLARLGRLCGVFPLENLHAGLFVAADDQFALLIEGQRLHVEAANSLSLGVEVGIVAVEPVDTAMGLQVGLVQHAPDGGAAHGFVGVLVDQGDSQVVQTPLTGRAVMLGSGAGGQP